MSKRILLVADISNLYFCVKRTFNEGRLDYAKLVEFIKQFGVIHRAIAYGCAVASEADSFKGLLRHCGFEVKYKQPKQFENSKRKGDWDVGIVIDVVSMVDMVDVVIFATADGDFVPCMEYVKSRGREAWVIGTGISREAKNVANRFFEISGELVQTSAA